MTTYNMFSDFFDVLQGIRGQALQQHDTPAARELIRFIDAEIKEFTTRMLVEQLDSAGIIGYEDAKEVHVKGMAVTGSERRRVERREKYKSYWTVAQLHEWRKGWDLFQEELFQKANTP